MHSQFIELKLRRVGKSLGVILPKKALQALGMKGKPGERLLLTKPADGQVLELRHVDKEFERQLALLRATMKRYRNTLQALAR